MESLGKLGHVLTEFYGFKISNVDAIHKTKMHLFILLGQF